MGVPRIGSMEYSTSSRSSRFDCFTTRKDLHPIDGIRGIDRLRSKSRRDHASPDSNNSDSHQHQPEHVTILGYQTADVNANAVFGDYEQQAKYEASDPSDQRRKEHPKVHARSL